MRAGWRSSGGTAGAAAPASSTRAVANGSAGRPAVARASPQIRSPPASSGMSVTSSVSRSGERAQQHRDAPPAAATRPGRRSCRPSARRRWPAPAGARRPASPGCACTCTCTAVACSWTSTPRISSRPVTGSAGVLAPSRPGRAARPRSTGRAHRRTGTRSMVATGPQARSSAASPSSSTASRRSRARPATPRSTGPRRRPVVVDAAPAGDGELVQPGPAPGEQVAGGDGVAGAARPRRAGAAERGVGLAEQGVVDGAEQRRAGAGQGARCSSATDPAVILSTASRDPVPQRACRKGVGQASERRRATSSNRPRPSTRRLVEGSQPAPAPRPRPGGIGQQRASCVASISAPPRTPGTSAARAPARWCRAAPDRPGGAGSG